MPLFTFGAKPTTTPAPDAAPAKAPSFSFTPTATSAIVAPSPAIAATAAIPLPSVKPPSSPVHNTVHKIASSISPKRAQPNTAESEAQRRVRRKILPALCNLLLDEVVSTKLETIRPDLEAIVKQTRAARAHALAKAKRQEEITEYAEQTYRVLLDQVIQECSREAYFTEKGRRRRLRQHLRGWRDWAARQREDREAAAREREQAYASLGRMGLAGSSFAWSSGDQDLGLSAGSRGSSNTLVNRNEQMDAFAADVMLHQTERAKDHFYSPSTFLATTARHLAPLVQPQTPARPTFDFEPSSYSSIFQTIISPSKDSATPSAEGAFEWLRSKFFPESSEFMESGITFEAHVLEKKDGFQTTSAGMLVLEAPLQTWSSEKQRT
jgi:hypothetical protein